MKVSKTDKFIYEHKIASFIAVTVLHSFIMIISNTMSPIWALIAGVVVAGIIVAQISYKVAKFEADNKSSVPNKL